MNKWKKIGLILGLFTYTPIWLWLMYQIMKRVEATELMWFLFWIYCPLIIFVQIIVKIGEDD